MNPRSIAERLDHAGFIIQPLSELDHTCLT